MVDAWCTLYVTPNSPSCDLCRAIGHRQPNPTYKHAPILVLFAPLPPGSPELMTATGSFMHPIVGITVTKRSSATLQRRAKFGTECQLVNAIGPCPYGDLCPKQAQDAIFDSVISCGRNGPGK